ncbi:MAG TPA: TonB-dependent receptor [Candidatus Koribacter sp.]|jgi:outer membrane cobalamin receptor
MHRAIVLILLLFWCGFAWAASDDGELRLKVTDPSGEALQAQVGISSEANQYHAETETNADGTLAVHRLPFGRYSLRVQRAGFSAMVWTVEIRSSVPRVITAVLPVATANETVNVTDADTLVDPERTASVERIGSATISTREGSLPGRSVTDLVNEQPGWLYEGDAVLHPRGSEYQTQFVVDGIPLTENRSPGLGPQIEAEDVQSMSVYTAGFPAEYGRKLGGVVEINTARDVREGMHGKMELSGGSFATRDGYAQLQYGWGANTLTISGDGGATDWYLNPPVLENFTNDGTVGDFAVNYERDLRGRDRIGLSVRREQARFDVPNELVQQAAGQRQNRGTDETAGVLSYQHVFTADLLAEVKFMARSTDATLASNGLATPIIAAQNRSYDEQYAKAALSYHRGVNEWKIGAEADFATLQERFSDTITNFAAFDPGTSAQFAFLGSAPDHEQAAFLQDEIHVGRWTASLGLRWDHYRLLVDKQAVSPRIGVARYLPPLGLVVHASYDRVFQTPAMENLLLASSAQVAALSPEVLRLPVRPSLGNDFEIGVSKELAGVARAEANVFWRNAANFADDDLLLNTSVSFPIAFRRAQVRGAEAKVELPQWKRLSGWVSYSYMQGIEYLPVTGGLFLGDEASQALTQFGGRLPITQDQRNTARARAMYAFTPRIWAAVGGAYGSGLPFEFEGTRDEAIAQYGQALVDRVDFARGRVKPNFSVDASVGVEVWKREKKAVRVQADVENLNDRLNLINFAGLFSGNSVAPPRSWSLRVGAEF